MSFETIYNFPDREKTDDGYEYPKEFHNKIFIYNDNYLLIRKTSHEIINKTLIDTILASIKNETPTNFDDIIENKIIYTEFPGDGKKIYYGELRNLPLTAFISSAGRLVLATSICEPCYGTSFSLQNKVLVCETCGTRWRNTDLFGLSGGCINYHPEELKYMVDGDYVVLEKELLRNWEPRFFTDEMK